MIKWTYEACYEEAKKYTSRNEFKHGNSSAYNVARKNKWIDDYNWLIPQLETWTYETCKEESRKYNSRKEFSDKCNRAYLVSLQNGWLDEFFPKNK